MLFPRTCKCSGICLDPSHEPDVLVVVEQTARDFIMRGATDKEKRDHKIHTARARLRTAQQDASAALADLARLGVKGATQ